jgi:uncharacterized Ntn-hydrolase superfamily protein
MTFSIAARCPESGMLGVAVSSSSPAVAARCAFVRARTGAVLSQNITDPRLGEQVLDELSAGAGAERAVSRVAENADHIDYRQLIAVDAAGGVAVFSGRFTLGMVSEARGPGVASAGNLLDNESVPQAVVDGFLASRGHLATRLLAAMQAGVAAGGEAGPIHSAGLKVADTVAWPIVDLRVDWSDECPIEQLQRTWTIYEPQLDAYVTRALDPSAAPSYGVPGDK